jgi:hypothetical protein
VQTKEKVSTYSENTKYTEVPLHTRYAQEMKRIIAYCKVTVDTKVKTEEVKEITGWGK